MRTRENINWVSYITLDPMAIPFFATTMVLTFFSIAFQNPVGKEFSNAIN